jgi:hypothetical protein
MLAKQTALALGLLFVLAISVTIAAEPAADAPAAPAQESAPASAPEEASSEDETSNDKIAQLITQLNDDKFAVRQDATRKLVEVGRDAIAPLAAAAEGPHLEVTMRAFDIFKKLLKSDPPSFAPIKQALEQLAKSENDAASTRAEKMLKEITDDPQQAGQGPFGFRLPIQPGGRIQFGNAQVQIQVQAVGGAGGAKKISIKNVNGVKEIDAEEGGRKVHIVDDPQGIKMEVTEKNKEGKEETKKYEAKDANELKKKHPEAHKLYEKYATNNGGIQIQAGPGQLQGARIQIGPNGIQLQPKPGGEKKEDAKKGDEKKADGDAADSEVEEGQKKAAGADLPKAAEQVRGRIKQAQKEAIDKQIEQLQKTIERLQDLRDNLDETKPDAAE